MNPRIAQLLTNILAALGAITVAINDIILNPPICEPGLINTPVQVFLVKGLPLFAVIILTIFLNKWRARKHACRWLKSGILFLVIAGSVLALFNSTYNQLVYYNSNDSCHYILGDTPEKKDDRIALLRMSENQPSVAWPDGSADENRQALDVQRSLVVAAFIIAVIMLLHAALCSGLGEPRQVTTQGAELQ